jgi:hypothetical protein
MTLFAKSLLQCRWTGRAGDDSIRALSNVTPGTAMSVFDFSALFLPPSCYGLATPLYSMFGSFVSFSSSLLFWLVMDVRIRSSLACLCFLLDAARAAARAFVAFVPCVLLCNLDCCSIAKLSRLVAINLDILSIGPSMYKVRDKRQIEVNNGKDESD